MLWTLLFPPAGHIRPPRRRRGKKFDLFTPENDVSFGRFTSSAPAKFQPWFWRTYDLVRRRIFWLGQIILVWIVTCNLVSASQTRWCTMCSVSLGRTKISYAICRVNLYVVHNGRNTSSSTCFSSTVIRSIPAHVYALWRSRTRHNSQYKQRV